MEPFVVISGDIQDKATLDRITSVCPSRYGQYKKAHHEWINSIEPGQYKEALDSVRKSENIYNAISARFPNYGIESVPETDEVYWSASPKEAKGSDRSLVDCHYDAPFAAVPNGGVIYYRVIVAVNENETVTTVFPNEDKRVLMNKGDFHGLDYNTDWHCVEGSIPQDKYRILLKLHYLLIPKNTSYLWIKWVKLINVGWTFLSRITMRMSADPKNAFEYFISMLVNVSRFIFNSTNANVCIATALVLSLFIFLPIFNIVRKKTV